MNEREAIQRLRRGDIGGLEALVREHQVRAVRAAYLITRDRAQAEDIVQAAFIRAFQRIDQFDPRRAFAPWFLRSVVNDAVKVVSRGRTVGWDEGELPPEDWLPDPTPSPESQASDAETRQRVWDAMGELPPEQRAAVVLRYFLDLNEREMADQLNTPAGTVKWRLHAAKARLRDLLSPVHAAVDEAKEIQS